MEPLQWHTRRTLFGWCERARGASDHTAHEVNFLQLPGAADHPQVSAIRAERAIFARHVDAADLLTGLWFDQPYLMRRRTERGQPSVGQCV